MLTSPSIPSNGNNIEYEQQGNERAEYGSKLLDRLSHDLSERYGKGFSRSNVVYIRKFYLSFQKGETVSHLLSWNHYVEILKGDDPKALRHEVQRIMEQE